MDWSATPDDPHAYKKLRAAVDAFAVQLDGLGCEQAATRLRDSQRFFGGSPSEWMGETAVALNGALSSAKLPDGLREDMTDTVEAIRLGFRAVGTAAKF